MSENGGDRDSIFPVGGEDMYPRKQTLWVVLKEEGNWKCFMLTLMIIGCMGGVLWCNFAEFDREIIDVSQGENFPLKRTSKESSCDVGYAFIPIVFMLLLYLVYLVECYHSTARIQLSNNSDVSAVEGRIHAMRTAVPKVWWRALCYHYVRRKRQVTRYRNGDAYLTSQVYFERVNTHSATTEFVHASCGQTDASKNLMFDIHTPITKVRFSKGFAFANLEAAGDFEDQRSRFFADNEAFDEYMEMREGLDLMGVSTFKENMVAYRDVDRCTWYSSQLVFWILSCLLLSWPLRIMLECNSASVHYKIRKIFGTNYEMESNRRRREAHGSQNLPSAPYPWEVLDEQSAEMLCGAPANRPHRNPPLSHASTVDSLELYAAIRENCALVPSYSEAIRIDAPLREVPEENVSEERQSINDDTNVRPCPSTTRAASFDEPTTRPKVLTVGTHSSNNIASCSNANEIRQQNRRSWTGVLSIGGRNARQALSDMRPANPSSYQIMQNIPHCSNMRENPIYYSRELPTICPRDPFRGRSQTTPTDEPPTYEEALRLPSLRKMTRSVSGSDMASTSGSRSAFIRDAFDNRRSGLEGVGILSAINVVRIPGNEDEVEETAL